MGTIGFRVWIGACGDWRPAHDRDHPSEVIALEPAEEGVFTKAQAASYVHAFNRTARQSGLHVWAIALPVVVRFDGDLQPGQRFAVRR